MIPLRWWGAVWFIGVLALLVLGVPAPPGPLEVRQTGTVRDLLPGDVRELHGVIDNPNWLSMTTVQLSAEVTGTNEADCGPEFFAIEGSPHELDVAVDPGRAQAEWSGLFISLLPAATANEACQGVEATIDYTLR